MISPICIAFPNKPSQCQSMAKFVQSINPLPIRQYVPNLMPIQCQCKWPFRSYTGNKLSTGTQLMVSTEDDFNRQCFINQSTLPILCQCIWPLYSFTGNKLSTGTQLLVSTEDDLGQSIPNSAFHQSTPMPILVNPVPIMCQSRSIQCQYTPVPVPIWSPSGSINCQSIVSSGQICPCLANTPIKCQYRTYLPIPGQSTNPMPIQYQSANSLPIRQSNTNLPI